MIIPGIECVSKVILENKSLHERQQKKNSNSSISFTIEVTFFVISDNCHTLPYAKSDGSYVCGYFLPGSVTFLDASIQCGQLGGRIAQPGSSVDNQYLQSIFSVSGYHHLIVISIQQMLFMGIFIPSITRYL